MVETLSTAVELTSKLVELASSPFRRRAARAALRRLAYLELATNLELFSAIGDHETVRALKADSPASRWLIANLQTRQLEAILLGDADAFGAVTGFDDKNTTIGDEDEYGRKPTSSYMPEKPVQVLRYLVVKTAFLRAWLEPESGHPDGAREVDVGLRLQRILDLSIALAKAIRASDRDIQKLTQKRRSEMDSVTVRRKRPAWPRLN